jgi:RNA polymerase sigma-70 factor (ECF subfamily)
MLAKAFDRLKSQEDAEEVVQELFIKIWRRKERIELQFSFKTYIFAALRYEILDFLAKQLQRKNHLSIDETIICSF